MDISIIIVNYNTLKLTQNTIDSIFEKTRDIEYEIILVDNDSKDGSKEFFKENYGEKIKFIQSDKNLGFGKANNLGIKEAKGKYIFLLNSDTILINNAIKILADFMENDFQVGICGGNLYAQEMKPTHSYVMNLISLKNEFIGNFIPDKIQKLIGKNRKDFNDTKEPLEVGYITGADMMIRKSILDEVGAFDPDFFMYYEETELSARISRAGYRIMSVPEAKIIHLEGQSFEFKETRMKMMTESKYKYFYKVWGKRDMVLSFWISQTGFALRYLFSLNNKYKKMIEINREEFQKVKDKLF